MRADDFLPLTPRFFMILLCLVEQDQHGYRIIKSAEEISRGRVRLSPGTLYEAIQRLAEKGLLEESDGRPDPAMDDQRRVYYRLTALGRRVVRAESNRLADLVAFAKTKRLVDRGR